MSQYVPVHVPEAHLPEVLRHLASLLSESPVPTPKHVPTQSAPFTADDGGWTAEVWRNVFKEVTPEARDVLVALAKRPDTWLWLSDLAEAIGTETRTVQDALSSLTKRMRKYGPTKWPFEYVKDSREGGKYRYLMSEETAAIVLGLAQDARPAGGIADVAG
jgi:hypothetical protein